jgi:hypothetical protein
MAFFTPSKKKGFTILVVYVIQFYKLFWGNKSKIVGQNKSFDGKPKMTKKIDFGNLRIPQI